MNGITTAFRNLLAVITVLLVFTVSVGGAEYTLRDDGSIRIGGHNFSSMQEFHRSDYFKENGLRCGTRAPDLSKDASLERSVSHCTKTLTLIQSEYWPSEVYVLPVWWHVITSTSGEGNVTDAAIAAQMSALNEDFRAIAGSLGANGFDLRIQFRLAGITRTVNNTWFTDSDEYGYKNTLRKDPNRYVNVYTNTAGGYLGYAYFPQDVQSGLVSSVKDGIVLNYAYVGGRNNGQPDYDQGRTLVHEMGHYLGLYHTFHPDDESSCFNSYASGDLIVDTNAEAEPNYVECVSASSCGSPDPIHNYMDYSFDSCMWEFTREQANRAVCSLVNFRPNIYSVLTEPPEPPEPPEPEPEPVSIPPLLTPLILKD